MTEHLFEHTFSTGTVINYRRLPSGTCYHAQTPAAVFNLLETYRLNQRKLRLFYGNPETGKSWLDEHDVIGTIGRSTGSIKVPLLIASGDLGGPALLDHCIIRIDSPRQVLYQHAQFHVGAVEIKPGRLKRLPWEVLIDNTCRARFTSKTDAWQYVRFLRGERFAWANG